MLDIYFRPLEQWPGKLHNSFDRKRSPFDSTYAQTLDLLEYELNQLNATDLVIQAQVDRSQIRNDGWLRSTANVTGPAVILSFTMGKPPQSYSYPCDTFTDWQANLCAIALSLEALRKVNRYGVTRGGEQYRGFKRLAPAIPSDGRQTAINTISRLSGIILVHSSSKDWIQTAYRVALKKVHPDVGGSREDFDQLQAAMGVLRG